MLVCIDASQVAAEMDRPLRKVVRLLRLGRLALITTRERTPASEQACQHRSSLPTLVRRLRAAGLHVLVREEHDDWLEQQGAFY